MESAARLPQYIAKAKRTPASKLAFVNCHCSVPVHYAAHAAMALATLEIFGACPGWPQRQLYNHKIWVWKLRLCGYFDVIIQFEIKNPEI